MEIRIAKIIKALRDSRVGYIEGHFRIKESSMNNLNEIFLHTDKRMRETDEKIPEHELYEEIKGSFDPNANNISFILSAEKEIGVIQFHIMELVLGKHSVQRSKDEDGILELLFDTSLSKLPTLDLFLIPENIFGYNDVGKFKIKAMDLDEFDKFTEKWNTELIAYEAKLNIEIPFKFESPIST